jgi:hypothetical protein
VLLLVATMVATLMGPVGVQLAAAQDDLGIQTRVQVLHADPALGQIEVHINNDEAPASRLPRIGLVSTTPSLTRSTRLPPTTTTT